MDITAMLGLAWGLSMDAFGVALCQGTGRRDGGKALLVGALFGLFQACMARAGSLLGASCQLGLLQLQRWLAFFLLEGIGLQMLREAGRETGAAAGFARLLLLAFATSVDALAAGVSLALVDRWAPGTAPVIGGVTAVLCTLGVLLGRRLRGRWGSGAARLGGCLLLGLGWWLLAGTFA